MSNDSEPVVYQLKILLLSISPTIWRRVLVRSDRTIEDLHYTVQLAMGWLDIHQHHFIIHGKEYGVARSYGTMFTDLASEVKLATFGFREKERFLYEYDFSINPVMGIWRYWWRHQIRVEAIKKLRKDKVYPVCTAGGGVCPPEDCGGPWGFMEARVGPLIWDVLEGFESMLENKELDISTEELSEMVTWLKVFRNEFDRQEVNQSLLEYFTSVQKSQFSEGTE